MLVNGTPQTTIWYDSVEQCVRIIDQTQLPHRYEIATLRTLDDFCRAIKTMQVRGAPLIGITAAFGVAMTLSKDSSTTSMDECMSELLATRPTAVNLYWAIDRIKSTIVDTPEAARAELALSEAEKMRLEDIQDCQRIGQFGLELIEALYEKVLLTNKMPRAINILTHCNAGWLATVDWGTALAPIYKAHEAGIPVHVWVDETRPRNQGASLTAWELSQQGISHTVIADNTGGHLMQHGMVDMCLVGSDRTSANGDVCNKIGTYLKALAASDNDIPFYVALPASTIDWTISNGVKDIPIEQRDSHEITHINGLDNNGNITEVKLVADSPASNYAFDVTPARLVTSLITERGIFAADTDELSTLYKSLEK